MRNVFGVLTLTAALSCPLALSQIALAQPLVTQTSVVAQVDDNWEAFANSKYTYWDARVLARFWGQDLTEAKSTIGHKLQGGPDMKLFLDLTLTDARTKALGSVENLEFFFDAGFTYDDAEAMAAFWGDPSPYNGKLRIERNLILGQFDLITDVLRRQGR